ncbi:Major Facilitator Superfamily protein [Corynebacterium bovis DSM 20582 = CIP 54.80]|nr:Major Facilitator Superfamily protein [Corynebacterium bovis DSM 20582 = CIP 54.80]
MPHGCGDGPPGSVAEMSRRPPAAAPPGDAAMTRVIWPALAAAALGLVPFTVFSTFLVGIADDAGADATVLGGLRGLGGVAALATGVACAPLIDHLPRRTVAAGALVVLALACAAGVLGQTWSWVVFCLLVGGGTATLTPAVTAAASDAFPDDATAGRAATLVSSTTTLTAMLAAPLLAGPALLWGWRGDLVAVAVLCVVAAVAQTRSSLGAAAPHAPAAHTPGTPVGPTPAAHTSGSPAAATATTPPRRPGYLTALRTASRLPAVVPLLGVSTARTAAFMGQLAFVAVFYNETFGLGPGVFSLVWSLSGLSFFLGNWFGGRFLRAVDAPRTVLTVTVVAALVGTGSVTGLFLAPVLPVALAMTSLTSVAHAVVAASVTTLLVRRAGPARGTVLSLNGAGQSLGTFGGAALAGLGISAGGWPGAAAVLALTTLLAVACALTAARSGRSAPPRPAPHAPA